MSHNNRIRLPGSWVDGSVVYAHEMEQADQAQYLALSEAGGTWAMASNTTIGGVGSAFWHFTLPVVADDISGHVVATKTLYIDVNGFFTAHGLATLDNFQGHITSGHTVFVDSAAFFWASNGSQVVLVGLTIVAEGGGSGNDGTLQIGNVFSGNGHLVVRAGSNIALHGTMVVDDDAAVSFQGSSGHPALLIMGTQSSLSIAGVANVSSTGVVNFLGNSFLHMESSSLLQFDSSAVLTMQAGSVFNMGASTTRTGKLIRSGANAHEGMRRTTGPDNDWTVPCEQWDTVRVPSTLTGGRIWTLAAPTDTSEAINITIQATVGSPGGVLSIKYGVALLATLQDSATHAPGCVTFEWDPLDLLYRVKHGTTEFITLGSPNESFGSTLKIPGPS